MGGLLLAGALAVVLVRSMVRALLALVFTFFMVGIVYLFLNAEFLFVVQLFVYTIAVGGLLAFAVLLTRHVPGGTGSPFNQQVLAAAVVALGLFALVGGVAWFTTWPTTSWPDLARTDDILERALLTRYAVPVVLVSVLLLAALIGAIVLRVREEPEEPAAVIPLGERRRRRRRRGSPALTGDLKK